MKPFSLRTLSLRGPSEEGFNANERKQAQMDRTEWPAGGTGPRAQPALPRGIG